MKGGNNAPEPSFEVFQKCICQRWLFISLTTAQVTDLTRVSFWAVYEIEVKKQHGVRKADMAMVKTRLLLLVTQ